MHVTFDVLRFAQTCKMLFQVVGDWFSLVSDRLFIHHGSLIALTAFDINNAAALCRP